MTQNDRFETELHTAAMPDLKNAKSDKLRIWSQRLRVICFILIGGLLFLGAIFLLSPETANQWLDDGLTGIDSARPLPDWKRSALSAVYAVHWLLWLVALWFTANLFGHYARGEIFHSEPCLLLRRLGGLLLLGAFIAFITPTIVGLIATIDNPPGEKSLVIAISTQAVYSLVAGGLLTIIGQILLRAVAIETENRQFV